MCLRRWILYRWNEYVNAFFFYFIFLGFQVLTNWLEWIEKCIGCSSVFVELIFWSKYWTDVYSVFYYLFFVQVNGTRIGNGYLHDCFKVHLHHGLWERAVLGWKSLPKMWGGRLARKGNGLCLLVNSTHTKYAIRFQFRISEFSNIFSHDLLKLSKSFCVFLFYRYKLWLMRGGKQRHFK